MKRKWKIHLEKSPRLRKQYITFIMNDYEHRSFGVSDFFRGSFQKNVCRSEQHIWYVVVFLVVLQTSAAFKFSSMSI